jgi:hypothetical protein
MGNNHAAKILKLQNAETDIIRYYYSGKTLGTAEHLSVVSSMISKYNKKRQRYTQINRSLEKIVEGDCKYYVLKEELIYSNPEENIPILIGALENYIAIKITMYHYACHITELKLHCLLKSERILEKYEAVEPTIF